MLVRASLNLFTNLKPSCSENLTTSSVKNGSKPVVNMSKEEFLYSAS